LDASYQWLTPPKFSNEFSSSQPSSQDFADSSPDSFATQVGSSFPRIRVRVGAAIAKAAAARFMPDSADDGLPLLVFWNKPTASKPSTTVGHRMNITGSSDAEGASSVSDDEGQG
jgi:hypothetical protein